MKDEAIETYSFSKLTLQFDKLSFFFFFQAVELMQMLS